MDSKPTEKKCADYEKYVDQLNALRDAVPFGEYPQFRDALIDALLPVSEEDGEVESYGCMVRSVINAMLSHMPDEHGSMECRHAEAETPEALQLVIDDLRGKGAEVAFPVGDNGYDLIARLSPSAEWKTIRVIDEYAENRNQGGYK